MENLLNRQFDEKLKEGIKHFKNYPELLPFVGKNWEESKKILLIGESHYLPYSEIKGYSSFDYFNNWYDGNSLGLDNNHKKYITTRNNIFKAEQNRYEKPLAMYFSLRKAFLELTEINSFPAVFDKFSYYNYFQKPASVLEKKNENRSINATNLDKSVAFETLLKVSEVLQPKTVIFASKKSFDACNQVKANQNPIALEGVTIDFVPHAGRQWWNKRSRVYGNRTGREKFIDIIKECYSK